MKIFQTILKSFGMAGIYQSRNEESYFSSLNWKNVIVLAYLVLIVISTAMFLVLNTTSFGEYSESIYYTISAINLVLVFTEFVRNTTQIFELITNFQNTIDKRKIRNHKIQKKSNFYFNIQYGVGLNNPTSNRIYDEMNEKVEKQTKLLFFMLFKVTVPISLMPNVIVSIYSYFSSDSGSEAFRLSFPIW